MAGTTYPAQLRHQNPVKLQDKQIMHVSHVAWKPNLQAFQELIGAQLQLSHLQEPHCTSKQPMAEQIP